MKRVPLALLSTVTSDAHTWNLVYMQLFLEEQGLDVVNLGPCVPAAEIAQAIESCRPDVVIISSVNGHGLSEAKALMRILRQAPDARLPPIVIGGQLTTSQSEGEATRTALLEAGFDAVFDGPESIETFCSWLRRAGLTDTGTRGRSRHADLNSGEASRG